MLHYFIFIKIEFPPTPHPEQLHEHNYYLRHDTANYPQKREYTVHVPWLPPLEISSSPRSDRTLCLDGTGPEVVRVASGNTISRFPDANRHPDRAVTPTWASFATPTRETWNPASPVPVTRTPSASTITNPFVTTAPDSLPQHKRSAAQNAKAPCVRRPPSTLVFSRVHIPNPPR